MKEYQIRRFQSGDEGRINSFFDALGFEARMFFNRLDGNRQGALGYLADDPEKCVRWMACDGEKWLDMCFYGIWIPLSRGSGLRWRMKQKGSAWVVSLLKQQSGMRGIRGKAGFC